MMMVLLNPKTISRTLSMFRLGLQSLRWKNCDSWVFQLCFGCVSVNGLWNGRGKSVVCRSDLGNGVERVGKHGKKKKEHRRSKKSFGGILRVWDPLLDAYVYAVVYGRVGECWSFPKGHGEANEDPMISAHREIAEEIGFDGPYPPLVSVLKSAATRLFVYDFPQRFPLVPRDSLEVTEAAWMTLEDLEKVATNKGLRLYVERMLKTSRKPIT